MIVDFLVVKPLRLIAFFRHNPSEVRLGGVLPRSEEIDASLAWLTWRKRPFLYKYGTNPRSTRASRAPRVEAHVRVRHLWSNG